MGKIKTRLPASLACISCNEPMPGITSYDVREICVGCGGLSKIQEEEARRKERARHGRRNPDEPGAA